MLPKKLIDIKSLLEKKLHPSSEDKELLELLKVIDSDSDIQSVLTKKTSIEFLKSFASAPEYCPTCGKKL